MKKSIKCAIYAVLTLAVIILGTTVYWLQYYNLFFIQELVNGFIDAVDTFFFGGFNFIFWSLGDYPAKDIALCSAATAAILAFFWIVETRLFKDKKWAFLTAPLAASALILAFALGGSIAENLIFKAINANPTAAVCINGLNENIYQNSSVMLPFAFSAFILEAATAAFLLLIAYGAVKKKGWNKFLVVSTLLLILSQFVYFFILPLAFLSLIFA